MKPGSQPVPTPRDRIGAVTDALSAPRLQPYLAIARSSARDALRLYRWNIEISGAMYESLHVVEVALRNAMDTQLSTWNANQSDSLGRPHGADWILDPSHLLQRLAGNDIQKATRRAQAAVRTSTPRRQPRHEDILAQLNFGTWRFLLPDRDPGRQRLWSDALKLAFPHLSGTPNDLVDQVKKVYRIRNRVAHLEPLLSSADIRDDFLAIRYVLSSIDPLVEQWFVSGQRVTAGLRARPNF